jgi:signal transduction histidine kinase
MRALLLELRPTPLEHLDLAGALRELAGGYGERLGLTVTVEAQSVALDAKREHALLRIAQEALANAARHSNATRVALCLAGDGDTVHLTIADNGDGFAAADGSVSHGLGLRIMRERVAELDGTLVVTTAPGEGARIAVAIPALPEERTGD